MMDQDYWNRPGPLNRPASGSMYPRIPPQAGQHILLPPGRAAPPNHDSAPQPSALGIRVRLKPEYQITPPPQLAPRDTEVPRSHFNFEFDFERKILAEAEKDVQNWTRVVSENQSSFRASITSSSSPAGDPVVEKYVMQGLSREPVSLAVSNFGDNPVKVREFVNGYNLLREMGFKSKEVAEVLILYDNDMDKAVSHCVNSS